MFSTKFGIEIEFTGITREEAAKVTAVVIKGSVRYAGTSYGTWEVTQPDGRVWKIMSDGSINCQMRRENRTVYASREYSVELVSPILTYAEDIGNLQSIVRALRKAGAFPNHGTGIHIHLDGADHTPRSIRNFVNIMASRGELLYRAVDFDQTRARYCQQMDQRMVERMNKAKPTTFQQIEEIWYQDYSDRRDLHYHQSRYRSCNLHSFFHGHHTVELRFFNSTLHAGEVRSYIVLALALNNQALTQKCASTHKPQTENDKFSMRTYLNRLGLIGDEFKACREHLTKHLTGSSAWRFHTAA